MNTNDKTLADVQPGGMVRLGDALPPLPEPSVTGYGFDSVLRRVPMPGYTSEQMRDYARAALTAQPSPGGQGEVCIPLPTPGNGEWSDGWNACREAMLRGEGEALAARQPVYVQGCDELRARTEGERAAYMEGLEEGKKIAARQPVGEPVGDHPPSLVDAAGMMAIESFLAVAEEFRRSAEPYIEAINEGGNAGDDEISEVFDSYLSHAKGAVSRSTICADSCVREKEGDQ